MNFLIELFRFFGWRDELDVSLDESLLNIMKYTSPEQRGISLAKLIAKHM